MWRGACFTEAEWRAKRGTAEIQSPLVRLMTWRFLCGIDRPIMQSNRHQQAATKCRRDGARHSKPGHGLIRDKREEAMKGKRLCNKRAVSAFKADEYN